MSENRSAFDNPRPPDSLGLLAIGIHLLRDPRTYGWYFILTIGLSIVTDFLKRGGAVASIIALLVGLLSIYAFLVLARQMMTGALSPAPFDIRNTMRFFLVSAAFGCVVALLLIVTLVLPVSDSSRLPIMIGVTIPAVLFLVSRISFYLPALALDDPTSVRRSFAQTAPYWKRLALVFLVVGGTGWLIDTLIERVGLPWVLQSSLQGVVQAAGAILILAADCYVYWKHVRTTI